VTIGRSRQLAIYALLILGVNVLVAHRLFTLEYSAHLESNEGSFMAISRIMATHPGDLLWWPFWDAGLPFQHTYFPLLHAIVAVFSRLTGNSFALSFHAVSGAFYCLGPVTLFLLAAGISGQPGYSACAALLYSLISPANFISSAIRADSGGLWNARRLQVLGFYGEGPHITTLACLPIAVLCIYLALRERRKRYYLASGLATVAVMLSNAFGSVDLLLAVLCLLALLDGREAWRGLKMVAAIGAAAYLVVSPIMLPSLLLVIRRNSQFVGGDYRFTVSSALGVAVLIAAIALCRWACRRWHLPAHLTFFLLLSVFFTGIPLLAIHYNIPVVPQPTRYQVEMELALCPLVVYAVELALKRMPGWMAKVALMALLALCVRQTIHYVSYAKGLLVPTDITTTTEYRLPAWVNQHLAGQRVMVTSTQSFLFSVFSDTPQLHGGHDPNNPNLSMAVAVYTLLATTGTRGAEVSVLWLKAFGAQAIAIPYPDAYYRAFADPKKFDGVLPVLWSDRGTVLYSLRNRSSSLAHVVPAEALITRTPIDGLDTEELARYASALDDTALPLAPLTWTNLHTLQIRTEAQPDQAISVQITWHPGWHARANGKAIPIAKDGIGLMALHPACSGPCTVDMFYDGGWELKATLLLSLITLIGCAVYFLRGLPLTKKPVRPV